LEISIETQIKIDNLKIRPVNVSDITQKREDALRETIREFEELLNMGLSKDEAARRLGYSDYASIWKKYEELKRIETEKKSKQQTFKDSLKVSNFNEGEQTGKPKTEEKEESIKILDTGAEK